MELTNCLMQVKSTSATPIFTVVAVTPAPNAVDGCAAGVAVEGLVAAARLVLEGLVAARLVGEGLVAGWFLPELPHEAMTVARADSDAITQPCGRCTRTPDSIDGGTVHRPTPGRGPPPP